MPGNDGQIDLLLDSRAHDTPDLTPQGLPLTEPEKTLYWHDEGDVVLPSCS